MPNLKLLVKNNSLFSYNVCMPVPLLQTKLHVPPLKPNLVSRPHLIEQLNQGLQLGNKLTLISAPAGFGKTTLVSEWVNNLQQAGTGENQKPIRCAWLSLDDNDNDSTRFLTYLVAALTQVKGVEANPRKGALGMLQSAQPPPAEVVLTSLINDMTSVEDRIILVLDDYHVIDADSVDGMLAFLIEYLPRQLHLVIATRSDPHLPFASYRAQADLTELRAAELRFSVSEAAEFLNQVMNLDLSPANVTALENRTEGWITGLQLAAISIRSHDDVPAFIKSFTGSHHFILDYLIEDVLEQQPGRVQTFLLQTAILNRMTGALCDAVTGRDNGLAMLEMLERDNLFVVRLDTERQWYRYYHLFVDLLRQRLRQTEPDQILRLHRRASVWYKQNGFIDEAIDHAIQANEFEQAAQLIVKEIDVLWRRGAHGKLQDWLGKLPEEALFSQPTIAIHQAWYLYAAGQLEIAERTLNIVEQSLDDGKQSRLLVPPAERLKLLGRVAATRALMSSYHGDVTGIIRYARQALEKLPEEDLSWRSVSAIALGNAYGFKGDMPAAYAARFEALRACEAAGDTYFIIIANMELAITLREQGQLQRTIAICRQQLNYVHENGLPQAGAVGWLLAVWGEILAELNDLEGAKELAKKGFQLTERSGDLQMFGWSFMCLIRVLISSGDLEDAENLIRKMKNVAHEVNLPLWITGQVAAWEARLSLAFPQLEAAAHWMAERQLDARGKIVWPDEIDFFSLFDYMVVSRALIMQERVDEAMNLLQHLLGLAEAGGRMGKVIEIQVLLALCRQALGQTEQALLALEHALSLAEREGFIRVFVDEGPPMARLLYAALGRGISPEYVRRLLAAFPSRQVTPADSPVPPVFETELFEPLSERELEVLQYIAEGLTNRAIGERLYLSLNTIKVHTRNIYGKLDVHSRTQAIARAQELGLL